MIPGTYHPYLRKTIGVISISFPLVLYVAGKLLFNLELQLSFSAYYHTPMQDIFVGMLCMLGILLILDNEYPKRDLLLSISAGLFAIIISLLPANVSLMDEPTLADTLHTLAALLLFILLAIIALKVFTQEIYHVSFASLSISSKTIYQLCGYIILLSVVLFFALRLSPLPILTTLQSYHTIFWLETAATLAFGFAWLTKGYEHR